MSRRITISACALAFALSVAACAQDPDHNGLIQLFSWGAEDGTTTSYEVDRSTFERSPAWDPTKDEPPLPVAKAIALASKAFLAEHPKFDSAKLSGVRLGKVERRGIGARWYYAVEFNPVIDGRELFGGFQGVILLLDGSIVRGTLEHRR